MRRSTATALREGLKSTLEFSTTQPSCHYSFYRVGLLVGRIADVIRSHGATKLLTYPTNSVRVACNTHPETNHLLLDKMLLLYTGVATVHIHEMHVLCDEFGAT